MQENWLQTAGRYAKAVAKQLGKKGTWRTIACTYWGLILVLVPVIYTDPSTKEVLVPPEIGKVLTIIGMVLNYVGLGKAAVQKLVGGNRGTP